MNQKINISEFGNLPDEALTSIKIFAAVIGSGVSTIYRRAALEPDFPKSTKFSKRCSRYRVGDIRAYIKRRG